MTALEKIQRGLDTSGRPLFATRQMFQHFDRVNDHLGGKLVIVQGSFNRGTTASAGTHDLAGCIDIRTWNLTTDERHKAQRAGRDPDIVGGAAWWYRTPAMGFDFHVHILLLGDAPMTPQTAFQVAEYRAGRNGLASRGRDDFWRPTVVRNYHYIEDDMFTQNDSDRLKRIEDGLNSFRTNEKKRDNNEAARDKARFEKVVTALGRQADLLTTLINQSKDDATTQQLKNAKAEILTTLKANPMVTGVDNPSDDAMATEL
jgi:hypothetical protein